MDTMNYPTAAESNTQNAGTAGDAAFGHMGSQASVNPGPAIQELQTLLNMKGFGPVQVTGTLDAATIAAAKNAGITVGMVQREDPSSNPPVRWTEPDLAAVNAGITLLKAPSTGSLLSPGVGPWYKQPKYILAGVAVLSVVGYIAYRTGALDGVLGDWDSDDEDESESPKSVTRIPKAGSTRRPAKPKSAKCAVVPDIDTGIDLEPPEGAEPMEAA